MRSGRIAGMMVIPRDFERRLLSGKAQSIPLYCDASHLLLYRSVLTGVQPATGSAAALMRRGGSKAAAASLQSAGRADVRLMYNPCGNYMLNTVPPVFVLIIQQILMAGCGMIEALRRNGGVPEGGLMHMAEIAEDPQAEPGSAGNGDGSLLLLGLPDPCLELRPSDLHCAPAHRTLHLQSRGASGRPQHLTIPFNDLDR